MTATILLFQPRDERVGRPYDPGTRTYAPTYEECFPNWTPEKRWPLSARIPTWIAAMILGWCLAYAVARLVFLAMAGMT